MFIFQMLYYLEPIALALKSHICQNTGCLACELGVLFYTLDVADDKITDIDNFIQVSELVNTVLEKVVLYCTP